MRNQNFQLGAPWLANLINTKPAGTMYQLQQHCQTLNFYFVTQYFVIANMKFPYLTLVCLLCLYNYVDCCGSRGTQLLSKAGAVRSIIGNITDASFGVLDLFYPVDVYASSCKRDHYQVCCIYRQTKNII